MLTLVAILAILAFAITIGSAVGKAPLWVAVFLLSFLELLRVLPLGR